MFVVSQQFDPFSIELAHPSPQLHASFTLAEPEIFCATFCRNSVRGKEPIIRTTLMICNRCAAGSAFHVVDVMLSKPNNRSEFDWGRMFVNPSQQNSSDSGEGYTGYKCLNCRCNSRFVPVNLNFVLSFLPAHFLFPATRFASTMSSRFVFVYLSRMRWFIPAISPVPQQPVLLLKMDTEGDELSSLQGLTDLLESKQVSLQVFCLL